MELVIVAMVLTTASLIGAFFLGNRFVNSSRYRYVAESRVTGRFTQGVSPLGISLELALLAFIGSRESVLTTGWLVGLGIVWSLLWGGALAFVRDADSREFPLRMDFRYILLRARHMYALQKRDNAQTQTKKGVEHGISIVH